MARAKFHIDDKALNDLVTEKFSDTIRQKGQEVADNIEALLPAELGASVTSTKSQNKKNRPVALQRITTKTHATPEELQARYGVFTRATKMSHLEIGDQQT